MPKKIAQNVIIINNFTNLHIGEPLFISGSFNAWKLPGVQIGNVPNNNTALHFNIENISKSAFEFKIHRGTWYTQSCDKEGDTSYIYNFPILQKDSLTINIIAWRDDFPLSTASPQVILWNEAFRFKHLNVERKIWIYLPNDYHTNNQSYPVLYMHDGQHLFDEATSEGRFGPIEWKVDKYINRSKNKAIVVAIAHDDDWENRFVDYTILPTKSHSHPKGFAYLKSIIFDLKPIIDASFRTIKTASHTAILGSSLGGLISIYAGVFFPNYFKTIGCFSPSIWYDQGNLMNTIATLDIDTLSLLNDQAYYFFGGALEKRKRKDGNNIDIIKDLNNVITIFNLKTKANIQLSINKNGKHLTYFWQQEFPKFYEWWHQHLEKYK